MSENEGNNPTTPTPASPGGERTTSDEFIEQRITATEAYKVQEEGLRRINDLMAQQLSAAQNLIEADRARIKNAQQRINQLMEEGKLGAESVKEAEALISGLGLSKSLQDDLNKSLQDGGGNLEEFNNKMEEVAGNLLLSKNFAKELDGGIGKVAGALGMASNASNTLLGSSIKIVAAFGEGNLLTNLKNVGKGFLSLFDPVRVLGSLLDIAVKKAIEFDNTTKNIVKSFGMLDKNSAFGVRLQDSLLNSRQELARAGISIADMGKSVTSLQSNFGALANTDFEKTTKTIAILDKFGVSAEQSAKNFTGLVKSLGMSGDMARQTMMAMATNAEKAGISAGKMASEFGTNLGYLALYGQQSVDVFNNLAAAAANAGTQVKTLIDLTTAFDKFSTGAEKAAQLNAVFGTSISSMAMMTMDAGERFEYLKNEINMAVGSVDHLTRAEKLALKEAGGFSNVAEMMAILGSNTAEAVAMKNKMARQASIEENMAKALEQLLPLQEKLAILFASLAENRETITRVANAIEFLVEKGIMLIDNIGKISGILGFGAIAFELYTMAIEKNRMATAKGIGKIVLIVVALYQLYKILNKRSSPPFYMLMAVMAMGVEKLIDALGKGTPQAFGMAIALALLAAATSLVFYGIAAVVKAITGLFTVLLQSVEALPQLALGMYLLGSAFLFLGFSAMSASVGLLMGLGALTVMLATLALSGTSIGEMMSIGDGIFKIGDGVSRFAQGLQSIKSTAAEIKSAMGDTMIAASMEGSKMSVVVGKEAGITTLFKNDTLNIKVDMPQINIPTPKFDIFIDGQAIDARIEERFTKAGG